MSYLTIRTKFVLLKLHLLVQTRWMSLYNYLMIYIYNETTQNIDWQHAYTELHQQFLILTHSYHQVINGEAELRSKLQQVQSQNDRLKNSTKPISSIQNQQHECSSLNPQLPEADKEKTTKLPKKPQPRIKRQISTEIDSVASASVYECTYDECGRVYSSPVSLNLHIKNKHNGGTKRQREAYAKLIIEATQRGEKVPEVDINFPPNFMQEFKISYKYMKKYNM